MNFRKLLPIKSWPITPLQKIILTAIFCLVFIPILLLMSAQSPRIAVDAASPRFSASRAFDTTREFVTQFPMRLFGSLESRQATGYLTDKLTAMGYEVEYIHYDGRIGGGQRAGRNVLAYKQGETDEIIAVTAHFDTARPTVQGAAKNGAAVGVLVELAGLFSGENTRRSLLFAFTDGGEWGATGANDLSLNYEKKDRIAAVLTLDYVAPGDLAGFRLGTTGQFGKFRSTPTGLTKLAEDAVREQAQFVPQGSFGTDFLENVFMISNSEQRPFLKARIPAINLGSFSTDGKREKDILHSPDDVIENLKIETMDKYGRVAEQIVRSLAEAPEIPRYLSGDSSKMRGKAESLCMYVLLFMFFILFLPTFRPVIQQVTDSRKIRSLQIFHQTTDSRKIFNLAQTGRELMAFFATWIPFLVLFLGIKLAYAARQFPFYDLYPAVAKDPAMHNPPWKVFVIIAAGVLFVAIAVWIVARYFLREWTKPDYQNSYIALCGVQAAVILLASAYNPFWGIVLFTAPFVLWPMPQSWKIAKSDIGGKVFGIAYVAAAAVPALFAFRWLAVQLGYGWNFFWYQALALTTGLFSPVAYFMGTAVIAVGIRIIVISHRLKYPG